MTNDIKIKNAEEIISTAQNHEDILLKLQQQTKVFRDLAELLNAYMYAENASPAETNEQIRLKAMSLEIFISNITKELHDVFGYEILNNSFVGGAHHDDII